MDNSSGGRRVRLIGFLPLSFLASTASIGGACGNGSSGASPIAGYSANFTTADVSAGQTASIRLSSDAGEVSAELLSVFMSQFVPAVKVTTWVGQELVPTTIVSSVVRGGGQSPNGTPLPAGYAQIDWRLDDSLDRGAWYAISVKALPARFRWGGNGSELFAFADGSLGVRISPAHPPVVASLVSCQKPGVVAVYVRFSEAIASGSAAIQLDAGTLPSPCTIGEQGSGEIQFICSGAEPSGPFAVHVGDSVVGQVSGSAMAVGTVQSGSMQVAVRTDGCQMFKPADPDTLSNP